MPIVKFPPSVSEKEALKIIQGQGFNTIISLSITSDGSKIINAI